MELRNKREMIQAVVDDEREMIQAVVDDEREP